LESHKKSKIGADTVTKINNFHVHVYYDPHSFEVARELCETLAQQFELPMGYMHQRPVGPHPDWSCQLTVSNTRIGEVISYLSINRQGLNIFVHPDTGQDLEDHRDRAIWIGSERPLDLSQFVT